MTHFHKRHSLYYRQCEWVAQALQTVVTTDITLAIKRIKDELKSIDDARNFKKSQKQNRRCIIQNNVYLCGQLPVYQEFSNKVQWEPVARTRTLFCGLLLRQVLVEQ